jgi:hypothetical protein
MTSSIGKQMNSSKRTGQSCHFGSSGRANMEKVGTFKDMMQCGTSVKLYHPKFWADWKSRLSMPNEECLLGWSLLMLYKSDDRLIIVSSYGKEGLRTIQLTEAVPIDDWQYWLISNNTQT